MRSLLLVLLCAAPLSAAPPKLDIPPEVKPVGDYALFLPDTDATSVVYVGLSGVDPFPSVALADKRYFALPVRGLPKARYKFAAVAAKDGEQTRTDFEVVVGDAPTPAPIPPDPAPVPVDVKTFYSFVVYKLNSPISPGQLGVMDGKDFEAAMDEATKGVGAWRRITVNAPPATLPEGLRETWEKAQASIQEKNSAPPLLVVRVNDKVYIETLPDTASAAKALLKKYRGK